MIDQAIAKTKALEQEMQAKEFQAQVYDDAITFEIRLIKMGWPAASAAQLKGKAQVLQAFMEGLKYEVNNN